MASGCTGHISMAAPAWNSWERREWDRELKAKFPKRLDFTRNNRYFTLFFVHFGVWLQQCVCPCINESSAMGYKEPNAIRYLFSSGRNVWSSLLCPYLVTSSIVNSTLTNIHMSMHIQTHKTPYTDTWTDCTTKMPCQTSRHHRTKNGDRKIEHGDKSKWFVVFVKNHSSVSVSFSLCFTFSRLHLARSKAALWCLKWITNCQTLTLHAYVTITNHSFIREFTRAHAHANRRTKCMPTYKHTHVHLVVFYDWAGPWFSSYIIVSDVPNPRLRLLVFTCKLTGWRRGHVTYANLDPIFTVTFVWLNTGTECPVNCHLYQFANVTASADKNLPIRMSI